MTRERLYFFDTTLRDGEQTHHPRARRRAAIEDAQIENLGARRSAATEDAHKKERRASAGRRR